MADEYYYDDESWEDVYRALGCDIGLDL